MMNHEFQDIEQTEGPPLVETVDPEAVDARRRETYLSYEAFLRGRLAELDRARPSLWQRDYSSVEAYLRSVPHAGGHISATRRAFEFLQEKLAAE